MNYKQAAKFVMPFGMYANKTIDDIGSIDEGLKYLDWLRGARAKEKDNKSELDIALRTYLDDETISKDLRKLIGY